MTSFAPDVSQWEPWRPEEVAERLAGVSVPWYIAGGWAIDLFLGRETREHGDIEIGIPADRFAEILGAFDGFELFAVGSGLATPLGEPTPRMRTRRGYGSPARARGGSTSSASPPRGTCGSAVATLRSVCRTPI